MSIVTLLIAVIVVVALFYVVGLIPDATLQKVCKAIIVIGALLWLISNLHALLHCCAS